MRAVIASGTGRYADPWHPFPQTSPLIAEILADGGFDVRIESDVDAAMTTLDGINLLVVNAGDPWRHGDRVTTPPESIAGLAAARQAGIGIIAMHCAVSSLRDYPEWAECVGAIWVPGASFHPPAGTTHIHGGVLPSGAQITSFDVFDERYCQLQYVGHSVTVATHEAADPTQPRVPTAWVRENGRSRTAVDVLGHDEQSYRSQGHRALLARLATWVTAQR